MNVNLTFVPHGPPNTFAYERPDRYHGIVSYLPLPDIQHPYVLLHPVASYQSLLVDLDRLATVPGTNAARLLPVRAFIRACIKRGPRSLPDLACYQAHPNVLASANIANIFFFKWACIEPEAWTRILRSVLTLFHLNAGRALAAFGRVQTPAYNDVISHLRAALYPVQKILSLLYGQRYSAQFRLVREDAIKVVLAGLWSLLAVHGTIGHDDIKKFFGDLANPDGGDGFLGVLYTAFWEYPRPAVADTFEIFPYVIPAEALAGGLAIRIQFDALESYTRLPFYCLTPDRSWLPRLPRSHVFCLRPLQAAWLETRNRCFRVGCPKEFKRGKTRKCKGCRRAFYCSKDCQELDWRPRHKSICHIAMQLDAQGKAYYEVDKFRAGVYDKEFEFSVDEDNDDVILAFAEDDEEDAVGNGAI